MPSYYDNIQATTANAKELIPATDAVQHFPSEGLFIGELTGGTAVLPALVDLREVNGLCFLYNNEADRRKVNACLERLVWRIAITVPSNLCELILYNGGNPGDAFNVHTRINKYLFDDRLERVYFDGSADAFMAKLNDIYVSIVNRMSTIRFAGKNDLVELNETLGRDARLKYEFIVLTDFPRHLRLECVQRIAQIVESGRKAGIYVLMSWDMNADVKETSDSEFDARRMLSSMELLFPQNGSYEFRGSGHDDVFNRFNYVMDDGKADLFVIEKSLQYIDIQAETARKAAKPSALKQDFDALEKAPYEPVLSEISVTVGLDVNDKHPVSLKFNSDHYIHGFVLGKSGSGKSVLLNSIICAAILKYSPRDLMLYLMDFKGVEFNIYRGLKHTKAVLVDANDPNMTLEVLRELWTEYERRKDLFDEDRVKQIGAYNSRHIEGRLPQILFIADECQEMLRRNTYSDNDSLTAIQNEINTILDKLARLGRSAGIHMLMATQQLDGVDLPESVLKNLTECFLLLSAPSDSNKLVPDSSDKTSKQMAGLACYYHEKELQGQAQTFYASETEILEVIEAAQRKAKDIPGNGENYFSGSLVYHLEEDKGHIPLNQTSCQTALLGRKLGIKAEQTKIPLRNDFSENILVFGANKKEQAIGVTLNALASLILSFRQSGIDCDYPVIDCLNNQDSKYKEVLRTWDRMGYCRLVPRQESGFYLGTLIDGIRNQNTLPTVLTIIGQDHFMEVKNHFLLSNHSARTESFDFTIAPITVDSISDISIDESAVIPPLTPEQIALLEQRMQATDYQALEPAEDRKVNEAEKEMTYEEAITFILGEGPLQGVHVLMQVDRPRNILFKPDDGDYTIMDLMDKFRHKVILQTENKVIQPMRFSHDIDVQSLSEDLKHLRAYYYPEGEDPVLFTPYLMPEPEILS